MVIKIKIIGINNIFILKSETLKSLVVLPFLNESRYFRILFLHVKLKFMSKKNDKDVYKAISKILNVDTAVLKKSKKLSQKEEWDSLNHLNILVKLDKMFHNKASSIVASLPMY